MADCKLNGRVVKVGPFVGRFGFTRRLGVLRIEVMGLELALGTIFLHFFLSKAFICLFAERFLWKRRCVHFLEGLSLVWQLDWLVVVYGVHYFVHVQFMAISYCQHPLSNQNFRDLHDPHTWHTIFHKHHSSHFSAIQSHLRTKPSWPGSDYHYSWAYVLLLFIYGDKHFGYTLDRWFLFVYRSWLSWFWIGTGCRWIISRIVWFFDGRV